MELIDIQKELPTEEVFFIDKDGEKDIIESMGVDDLDNQLIYSNNLKSEYPLHCFDGHWIKINK